MSIWPSRLTRSSRALPSGTSTPGRIRISAAYTPLILYNQRLSVQGSFARSVYNAVAELRQLSSPASCCGHSLGADSAATTYLKMSNYILSADKPSSYTQRVVEEGFTVAPKVVTIDLKPYVTTGFADEVDGDKKGGWTDQGDNDMRMMVTGRQEFLGVPMEIIDPATNNGKSCIVLAGPSREYFPEKVEGIAVGQKLSRLFFLHSLAWSSGKKVGEYRIHYADQTTEIVDIVDGQNIGDWWFPGDLSKRTSRTSPKTRLAAELGFGSLPGRTPNRMWPLSPLTSFPRRLCPRARCH